MVHTIPCKKSQVFSTANALARLTPACGPQPEIMHIVCSVVLRPGQHLSGPVFRPGQVLSGPQNQPGQLLSGPQSGPDSTLIGDTLDIAPFLLVPE